MTAPWPTRTAVALIGLLASGCAALAISDHYASSFDASNRGRPVDEEPHLEVEFRDDTRFLSIGVLGAPILPTFVAFSSPSVIELRVSLGVRPDSEFSLPSRPCLALPSGEPLCAETAGVSWLAEKVTRDADGTLSHGVAFQSEESWPRGTALEALPPEPSRVFQADVYARAGYAGQPPLSRLYVTVVYTFTCPTTCPQSFALDAGDLALVAGTAVQSGGVPFQTQRKRDYWPLVIPGMDYYATP